MWLLVIILPDFLLVCDITDNCLLLETVFIPDLWRYSHPVLYLLSNYFFSIAFVDIFLCFFLNVIVPQDSVLAVCLILYYKSSWAISDISMTSRSTNTLVISTFMSLDPIESQVYIFNWLLRQHNPELHQVQYVQILNLCP